MILSPGQLPVTKLVSEQVPAEHRSWVEASLLGPLNRLLAPLQEALARIFVSQLNVQVLEHRGLPPSTTRPAEFVLSISGKVAGVSAPIYCRVLESSGQEGAAVGALTSPVWTEVSATDRAGGKVRITSQETLTPTTKYVLRWLVLGSG
jgi:hypothetical protein